MGRTETEFLEQLITVLVRLRDTSEQHGRPMLASMIDFARTEAEDELRTDRLSAHRLAEFKEAGAAWIRPDLDREFADAIRADRRNASH